MLTQTAKGVARTVLRNLLPKGRGRRGTLAAEGGTPVRDTRLRPWPLPDDRGVVEWMAQVGPLLRSVYLGGEEGVPQPLAQRFASEWAKYCGTRHCVLVSHGTDALRIALAAALDHDGLDYGGEVIVPNYSFIATATAALDRRLGVALVDVDPTTLLLDPARVEEAIVPGRTRAIVPVHLFGHPANITALNEIAKRHGLVVIEDAAQAHGAESDAGSVGSLGTAGIFSFQSSKVLNSGEGGALVTSDDALFERAVGMHDVGRVPGRRGRWEHATLGWNMRPTEYQAALLIHRLSRFDALQARRRENFERLQGALRGHSFVEPLPVLASVRRHGMYMFAMRYLADRMDGLPVDEFVRFVQAEGIPLFRSFQATLSSQPAIRSLAERRPEYFQCPETPVAESAVREVIYLPHPVFLGSPRDVDDILAAFEKVWARFR